MCEHPLAYDLNRLDDRLLVDASCSGHRRVRQREIAMHFVRCRRTTDQRTNLASVDHAITTLRARASWRNTFTRLVRVFSCQGLNRPGNCTQSSSNSCEELMFGQSSRRQQTSGETISIAWNFPLPLRA